MLQLISVEIIVVLAQYTLNISVVFTLLTISDYRSRKFCTRLYLMMIFSHVVSVGITLVVLQPSLKMKPLRVAVKG